jgi:hypothetical protein
MSETGNLPTVGSGGDVALAIDVPDASALHHIMQH